MIESSVDVVNRAGLHTRPAAMLVKIASKFQSEIYLVRDGFSINAKSIIGVMTLAAEQGARLGLTVVGADEQEAANAIKDLFASGFDEP
ncbi:MAG: HPr family phosphocarrier protein [Candidatus Kapabacteria bacterium]|nr:HPr family phosphocarrier protein [Candidatus Kapabacteria bacterium]